MNRSVGKTFGVVLTALIIWLNNTATAQGTEPLRIVHPIAASGSNAFIDYYWKLLEEACRRTEDDFGPFEIVQTDDYMNHLRAMEELSAGNISVYVRAFITDQFADSLDLVAFPLDRGLIGHRIALIHEENQERISEITTIEDLRNFRIGQGSVWLDSDILEAAQMSVVRSTSYDGLFPMLANRRIELFTRGSNEVLGEYLAHREQFPEIRIENSLLISYPMSFYFLVRNDDAGRALKERLTTGLNRMLEDGSFDRNYEKLKETVLDGVKMRGRRIIRIPNNFYNRPEYRTDDPTAWDDLAAERGIE